MRLFSVRLQVGFRLSALQVSEDSAEHSFSTLLTVIVRLKSMSHYYSDGLAIAQKIRKKASSRRNARNTQANQERGW